MHDQKKLDGFEAIVLPQLGAAYNLARWLTRNDHDAEDVVQEAYLRAFRFFDGFRGGDVRAWLLTIVRNTYYTWLSSNRLRDLSAPLEDEDWELESDAPDPELNAIQTSERDRLEHAIEALPAEFREVLTMREIEEMSYKEISDIVGIPIGTVMSRLARARKRLQRCLANVLGREA
ncbi:MAG TPA: sigma-70 family RNA polymerase sigma factor [Blastocatellia bacterium]|nr:sigma-70 family RNA polymerase sigma factor [Blastocatellia bacterium]